VTTAFIGGGVMGSAILRGALKAGVLQAEEIVVAEILPKRRAELENEFGVTTTDSAATAMKGATTVVAALKPQDLAAAATSTHGDPLVISIMAGVSIKTLRESFGSGRIVRVMPNTPAAIGAGMSAWTATDAVSGPDREFVGSLLSSLGQHIYVSDEAKIDMATAVNGSGPGFIFLIMEAMVDAAVAVGLTRAQAEPLVRQTFLGSAAYASENSASLADLKAQVTSPAGTTAAGLFELERLGVRGAIMAAVKAAHLRAGELGRS
jgi:pyrroline-5-carboxylate reductase